MLNIGCHLSVSKGYEAMGKEAVQIKANTFQYFTRNPRGSKAKDIDPEDTLALQEIMKQNNFAQIIGHAPYTLNPAAEQERVREFALEVMEDDIKRMEYIPHNFYNFHPGSHVGQGVDKGIERTIEVLNHIISPDQTTIVLIETMAGKGTEIGKTFEELARILEGVKLQDKVGICMDTCHVYDAGYDIVNHLDEVLDEFDQIIGLPRLRAIHINDSKNPIGSHKDRHEKIGEGTIGLEAFTRIINHPKLRHLPFVLETPNEIEGYRKEIEMLRNVYV